MTLTQSAENMASRNSGMLTMLLLVIQLVLVPLLGWMLVKTADIQNNSNHIQRSLAVFSDRQTRQGSDILDIKNTLKGVETKDDANAAHHQIWQTDQDQYQKIRSLTQQQQKIKSRVQRLETLSGKN